MTGHCSRPSWTSLRHLAALCQCSVFPPLPLLPDIGTYRHQSSPRALHVQSIWSGDHLTHHHPRSNYAALSLSLVSKIYKSANIHIYMNRGQGHEGLTYVPHDYVTFAPFQSRTFTSQKFLSHIVRYSNTMNNNIPMPCRYRKQT